MRIKFKSVPILKHETSYTYSSEISTTTYNMGDVRDHEIELSLARLLLCWGVVWRTALIVGPIGGFLLGITYGRGEPFPPYAILVSIMTVTTYFVSVMVVRDQEMVRAARRDRGASESAQFAAVDVARWSAFCAKLKPSSPFVTPVAFDVAAVLRDLQARRAAGEDVAALLKTLAAPSESSKERDPKPPA